MLPILSKVIVYVVQRDVSGDGVRPLAGWRVRVVGSIVDVSSWKRLVAVGETSPAGVGF